MDGEDVVVLVLIFLAMAGLVGLGYQLGEGKLAEDIAKGRATVEMHEFGDGTQEVKIVYGQTGSTDTQPTPAPCTCITSQSAEMGP